MCNVSMVGDAYRDSWLGGMTGIPYGVLQSFLAPLSPQQPGPTQAEFDALKKEVMEMKACLSEAKKRDEDKGQKDCEMADKVALLKQVAKLVGVNLDDVLGA